MNCNSNLTLRNWACRDDSFGHHREIALAPKLLGLGEVDTAFVAKYESLDLEFAPVIAEVVQPFYFHTIN